MHTPHISEPGMRVLSLGQWRGRLARLSIQAASAEAEEGARWLRSAAILLALAPTGGAAAPGGIAGSAIEAMIRAGASDSAALALVPAGTSFMLSSAGDDQFLATVLMPGEDEEVSARGASLALALIAALAGALAGPDFDDDLEREFAGECDAGVDTSYAGSGANDVAGPSVAAALRNMLTPRWMN